MLIQFGVIFLASLLGSSGGLPLDAPPKDNAKKSSKDVPSHLLEMEHKAKDERAFGNVMKKVVSSKAVDAVDDVISSVVTLAGGVVEDLGDIMVETIDQLPSTIRAISELVGKAVDGKREKALILIRGIRLDDSVSQAADTTSKKFVEAVDDSKVRLSITKLEESLASLLGKFIGVTYKNAQHINNAFSDGFRRITGQAGNKSDPNDGQLDIVKILKAGDDPVHVPRTKIVNFLEREKEVHVKDELSEQENEVKVEKVE